MSENRADKLELGLRLRELQYKAELQQALRLRSDEQAVRIEVQQESAGLRLLRRKLIEIRTCARPLEQKLTAAKHFGSKLRECSRKTAELRVREKNLLQEKEASLKILSLRARHKDKLEILIAQARRLRAARSEYACEQEICEQLTRGAVRKGKHETRSVKSTQNIGRVERDKLEAAQSNEPGLEPLADAQPLAALHGSEGQPSVPNAARDLPQGCGRGNQHHAQQQFAHKAPSPNLAAAGAWHMEREIYLENFKSMGKLDHHELQFEFKAADGRNLAVHIRGVKDGPVDVVVGAGSELSRRGLWQAKSELLEALRRAGVEVRSLKLVLRQEN